MKVKAKSSSTPYPIWIEGEYITEPPIRPSDGAVRPAGHYIDKGGYPGANVYEIDINTLCRQTDAADRYGKPIYEQDILLYETAEEIGYFIVHTGFGNNGRHSKRRDYRGREFGYREHKEHWKHGRLFGFCGGHQIPRR